MSLNERQNKEQNIKKLAAQSYLYSKAKLFVKCRARISVVVGIAGIFATLVLPSVRIPLAILGIVWSVVVAFVLKSKETSLKKMAATIQEEFDCDVYDMKWNSDVAGNKITSETIFEESRKCKRALADFKDWYGNLEGMVWPLNILVCQRQNIVWDGKLHEGYAQKLLWRTVVFFLVGIGVGLSLQMKLWEYLSFVLSPSLAAIIYGLERYFEHGKIASEKKGIEQRINGLIEDALKNPASIPQREIRALQNNIFLLRSTGPLNPDDWYDRLLNEYQINMNDVVKDLRDRALAAKKQ